MGWFTESQISLWIGAAAFVTLMVYTVRILIEEYRKGDTIPPPVILFLIIISFFLSLFWFVTIPICLLCFLGYKTFKAYNNRLDNQEDRRADQMVEEFSKKFRGIQDD